jgi:hypothetical protein
MIKDSFILCGPQQLYFSTKDKRGVPEQLVQKKQDIMDFIHLPKETFLIGRLSGF